MPPDTLARWSVAGRSRPEPTDASGLARLITELGRAGLVSAGIGEDGAVEYALTSRGVRAARQMAMGRDAYARILLGALHGAGDTSAND